MNKITFFILSALFVSFTGTAQITLSKVDSNSQDQRNPSQIVYPKNFYVSQPVRDMPVCDDLTTFDGFIIPKDGARTSHDLSAKRKRKLAHLNSAKNSGNTADPILQMGIENNSNSDRNANSRAPIANFEGIGLNASPPDPSMAVGPNHVVTMENGLWSVYDKNGNQAPGFPKTLNDPLSGPNHADNAGDPVVMYDRQADRWFLSQFQLSGNPALTDDVFLIGISVTPDPTGAYFVYEYELNQGNDYPHYGVWGDSYVTAGNFTGAQKVYTFNRTKMLAGDGTAEIAGFSPANLGASGFAAPIPAHAERQTASGDIKILFYQDDAFGGVAQDHIGLWNIDMDWTNATTINNSTISGKNEINVSAFDAAIAGGFANLQQPGTTQRIDAIVGAVMNMCQWYEFPGYQSLLLNWVVEIQNGSQKSGIRWVELRSTNNGSTWIVHQEGTFTDPAGATVAQKESVFMGCMSMDKQGNIGLGYTKTGSSTFPSLYYTGRMAGDPLGTMTVPEELVIAGTNSVTGNDRYGDYGQGVTDPVDDLTFWVTSEYSGDGGANGRQVRVYSYKLGTDADDDVAVTAIDQPNSGSGLSNSENVTVTISNLGLDPQSNIPVTLSLDGTLIATETFSGTIAGGSTASYTFTATVDLSTQGQTYILEACTALVGDEVTGNDCAIKNVSNQLGTDLAITAILNPTSGPNLTTTEDVLFTVENLGANGQSNTIFEVTIDGGAPFGGTYAPEIAAGASINLNFADLADLSALGLHTICVTANAVGDEDTSNDTLCIDIITLSCVGNTTTGCNIDGIKQFVLGDINVDDGGTGCNTENDDGILGYANRTNLSTDLDRASGLNTHTLQARTNFNPQHLNVWIDFNNNGLFTDAGEQLINEDYTIVNALENFSLTIPSNAALGTHILRAKSYDPTGNPADGSVCGDIQYGETHDYTVNIIDSSITCQGATITWDGSGWIGGMAPGMADTAVIDGAYDTAADGNIDVCELTVNTGVLTVDAGTYVRVQNDITVDSGASLLVSHQGSVVQVEDDAVTINNGTINVTAETLALKPRDFTAMGSPMSGVLREGDLGPLNRVMQHITANFIAYPGIVGYNFLDDNFDNHVPHTGVLNPGEGYFVRPRPINATGNEIYSETFTTGTLNSGDVDFSVGYNGTQGNSYNLLANPYASAIDARLFIADPDNSMVNEIYLWEHTVAASASFPGANTVNHSMENISMFNLTGPMTAATAVQPNNGYLSTSQGFGILSTASGTATFKNSMRITDNNNTLRTAELAMNRVWLKLSNTTYDFHNTALIGFTASATDGLDAGYDSGRMATVVALYSHLDDGSEQLAIQGRSGFDAEAQVKLGFGTLIEEVQSYTISLDQVQGGEIEQHNVYLVDKVLGTITNLSEQAYSFTSDVSMQDDRFIVQFTDRNVLNTTTTGLEAVNVYPNPTDGVLYVNSPESTITSITITDIQGRMISTKGIQDQNAVVIDLSGLNSALYFINIQTEHGKLVKQVIKK